MQFTGADIALERAIEADDALAVAAAISSGANANARGAHGVTPLEFAFGTRRKGAAQELIRHGADPNLKDDEGDSAVTLAVNDYARDAALLHMVLDAGGDPNTQRPNGAPVITRFLNDFNLEAATFLHSRGASIDVEDNERPMVVSYAISLDWDVVWHLIELGARLDTPKVQEGLMFAFKRPEITPPDSPLYPAKVKVWQRLKQLGLNPTPPLGM